MVGATHIGGYRALAAMGCGHVPLYLAMIVIAA
jgi:hypothetical protein